MLVYAKRERNLFMGARLQPSLHFG